MSKGRLVAFRYTSQVCTRPLRLCEGKARLGSPASAGWIGGGRNPSFCRCSPHATFALSRVRSGRFTPPATLTEWAMLLGGSEACPVPGPPASPALQGAPLPLHGLSALRKLRSVSKIDSPYANCSWKLGS